MSAELAETTTAAGVVEPMRPANECQGVDVDVTVWDGDDGGRDKRIAGGHGRIHMEIITVGGQPRKHVFACVTPDEARRVVDLLLAAVALPRAPGR